MSAPPKKHKQPVTNLQGLIHRLDELSDENEQITLGKVIEAVGRRSFGPVLLATGLIVVTPLSGVPGLPTTTAMLVFLVGIQLLFGRHHFWLPQWIVKRGVSRQNFKKALDWMRRPARWIDRVIRPRLAVLTHRAGAAVITAWCVLMALFTPPLELLPFATSLMGAVYVAFGLSLIAHDGLLALVAFAIAGTTVGLIVRQLL
jgi:hypothetical protein